VSAFRTTRQRHQLRVSNRRPMGSNKYLKQHQLVYKIPTAISHCKWTILWSLRTGIVTLVMPVFHSRYAEGYLGTRYPDIGITKPRPLWRVLLLLFRVLSNFCNGLLYPGVPARGGRRTVRSVSCTIYLRSFALIFVLTSFGNFILGGNRSSIGLDNNMSVYQGVEGGGGGSIF
jgi:hypothetical protein